MSLFPESLHRHIDEHAEKRAAWSDYARTQTDEWTLRRECSEAGIAIAAHQLDAVMQMLCTLQEIPDQREQWPEALRKRRVAVLQELREARSKTRSLLTRRRHTDSDIS